MDFDNHTDTQYYVRPSSKLWRLKFLDLNTRLALNSVGITTVGDIQNSDPALVRCAVPSRSPAVRTSQRVRPPWNVLDLT